NISYLYSADGTKVKKTAGSKVVDYLNGFQYENSTLQFFPTSEGYFDVVKNKYIYNYTDHLGNVRLSYMGSGPGVEIIEESNYYPFGLKHEGYNTSVGNAAYQYKYQGQELQETGFYSFKWRNYMPDVGRFFNIDPLAEKYTYNSTYAFQENKLGMGVELEGLELLKNHTGFFAIHGNAMKVVRAPGSQMSNGRATFTAADIGLTTKGYNPNGARISDGSSGLRLKSHAYSGPTPNGATMENVQETPESMDSQKFTTTKRGLEMTNKMIKNYDKLNTAAGGAQELVGLMDLASNIPDAIKSTGAYVQASKDITAIDGQAKTMDRAIDLVNSSGIDMTTQTRNDVINYVFDGTVPNPGAGLMPNSLIIQNGTQILRNNKLPIQPLDEQINTKKSVLP
ncbi:RHS repeat domain-containing protein, partial [Chryseobacterium indologenes]